MDCECDYFNRKQNAYPYVLYAVECRECTITETVFLSVHSYSHPQVAAGREWYIHTIYTVRSKENTNRGIGKRSLEYHSFVSTLTSFGTKSHRRKRSAHDKIPAIAEDIGIDNGRGTNIMHIALDRTKRRSRGSDELFPGGRELGELNADNQEESLVSIVGVLVGLLLTVLIIVTIALVLKSKQKDGKEVWREGVQEVVKGSVSTEPMLVVRMQDCHNSSEVWAMNAWIGQTDTQNTWEEFLYIPFPFLSYFYNTKNIQLSKWS